MSRINKALRKAARLGISPKAPETRAEVDAFERRLTLEEVPTFRESVEYLPRLADGVLAAALETNSVVAEQFRTLRAKVRAIGEERPFRCVGMVSAGGGEGKTTAALGLAMAMAQEPARRILLVEADLRRPVSEAYLGLKQSAGLGDWLQAFDGAVPLRQLMPHGLFLLPAGRSGGQPSELLGSARMAHMLESARRAFDFVLVDCPPLIPVADSLVLQELVDGFLFVVRARKSPREAIQRAMATLKADRIQGVIFNDYREMLPTYHNYGYRDYLPKKR